MSLVFISHIYLLLKLVTMTTTTTKALPPMTTMTMTTTCHDHDDNVLLHTHLWVDVMLMSLNLDGEIAPQATWPPSHMPAMDRLVYLQEDIESLESFANVSARIQCDEDLGF